MSEQSSPQDRPEVREQVAALEAELGGVARRVESRIDPGGRAMVVSVAVLAVVAGLLLPWVGPTSGWQVLMGDGGYGLLPRLFSITAIAFGVLVSVLALSTRIWVLAWLAAVGCGIAAINGVWAIWSRQSVAFDDAPGPGSGLVLAGVGVIVLCFVWAGVALRR